MTVALHRHLLIDLLAITILCSYAGIVRYTNRGAADPTWIALKTRGVLRVGTDPGFRPFAEERDGQLQGYDVDLVRELARRLDLRVEFVPVGFDALYDALGTERVDMLAAALPLAPEQGWRARFSRPYLNAGQLLVVRRGSGITAEADLVGRRVGVALGSDGDTLARGLRRGMPTLDLNSSFERPEAALDALATGAVDAVIIDAVSAIAAVNDNGELEIARALTFEPFVLAVPVGAYQLQREVDQTLDAMQRDGVFDQLNARWFRHQQP